MDALGVCDMKSLIANDAAAVPMFEKAFSLKTSDEWLAVFKSLDIVSGKLNHFADVFEDPQALANNYVQRYTCANGAERMIVTSPVRMESQGYFTPGKAISYCGEHNNEILNPLGYDEAKVAELKAAGVLY